MEKTHHIRQIPLYIIIFICFLCLPLSLSIATPVLAKECIILLHGLARTKRSMEPMEKQLKKEGFTTVNIDYPSTEKTIEQLAPSAINKGIDHCRAENCSSIHFVTHSMGGILVRYYLKENNLPELGRTVMISPPNHGSEIVDTFGDFKLFSWWNGPAGGQLGTTPESFPNSLGAPYFNVGIITGESSFNPLFSSIIPGKDDGKVSVKSAQMKGMKDFLVVHRTHTFIMRAKEVKEQTAFFLKTGKFKKEQ